MTRRRWSRTLWSAIESYRWQIIVVAVLLMTALAIFDPPIR